MVVDDFDCGVHHCAIVLVDATGEVDVFGIHEKTRVEESDFAECIGAKEHKAPREIGHIEELGFVVGLLIEPMIFEFGVATFGPRTRQETTSKEVERSGELFGQILYVAIGIAHEWHSMTDIGVGVHELHELRDSVGSEFDVGIENKVISSLSFERFLESDVVSLAIPEVGFVEYVGGW